MAWMILARFSSPRFQVRVGVSTTKPKISPRVRLRKALKPEGSCFLVLRPIWFIVEV